MRWTFCICLVVSLAMAGCVKTVSTAPPTEREATLAEQIQGVRDGRSEVLRLDETIVHDADLQPLADVAMKVRRINFSHTDISDAGLAQIGQLENLEQLRLASPKVTDAGMEQVARLTKLRFLHLLNAPVGDAGLDKLHGLTQLESLYLDHTNVTDEGLARLLKALPQVHLHIDDHHHRLDENGKEHKHD